MPTRRDVLRTAALAAAVLAVPALPAPVVNDRLVRRCNFRWSSAGQSVQDWSYCTFADLREGDVFELFESNGKPVSGESHRFVCMGDAFVNERGIWGVECEPTMLAADGLHVREGFDMFAGSLEHELVVEESLA